MLLMELTVLIEHVHVLYSWNCRRPTENVRYGSDPQEENATVDCKMDKAKWMEISNNHFKCSLMEQHDMNNFVFI